MMWDDEKGLERQLLGYYGYEGGYPPGGFLSSLLGTWEKADQSNRSRLGVAFPELAGLLRRFQSMDPEAFRAWVEAL